MAEPESQPESEADWEERRSLQRIATDDWWAAYALIPRFSFFSRPKPDGRHPVVDLHRSGAQVLINEDLRRGQKVLLALAKKRHKAFRVEGEVVWTGEGAGQYGYRIGVHFTNYRGDSWQRLQHIEDAE